MKRLDEHYRTIKRPVYEYNADGIPVVVREESYITADPVPAVGAGERFLYHLPDTVIVYALSYGLGYAVGYLIVSQGVSITSLQAKVGNYLLGWLATVIFFSFFEYVFQQTPGKMISKVVVVDDYGQKPTFKTCLLRSLSRLVPFEAFSCLGSPSRGWHDKWTDTYVMKKADLNALLQDMQDEQEMAYDSLIVEEKGF